MSDLGIVDWGLATRIGGAISGREEPATLTDDRACAVGAEALERALDYTTLEPKAAVPPVEVVSRRAWIEVNLDALRKLAAPVEARAASEISLPWPLDGVARGALGATAGAEAGAVLGYASRRVLGQYVVSLAPEATEPRMILVGANLGEAATQLAVDPEGFLLWVTIHEQTHSIQFAAVPWLRSHVAALITELIESAGGGIDFSALVAAARRLVAEDPREALRQAMRGELTRVLAGPEQAAIFDRMQAVMAVIEGYAEHVMDAAAADDESLAMMRKRMTARRARRGGLADVIARMLGLGMKLRQYELGKAWSDAVVAREGIRGLDRVWEAPERLPTLAELEAPDLWIDRVLASPAT